MCFVILTDACAHCQPILFCNKTITATIVNQFDRYSNGYRYPNLYVKIQQILQWLLKSTFSLYKLEISILGFTQILHEKKIKITMMLNSFFDFLKFDSYCKPISSVRHHQTEKWPIFFTTFALIQIRPTISLMNKTTNKNSCGYHQKYKIYACITNL